MYVYKRIQKERVAMRNFDDRTNRDMRERHMKDEKHEGHMHRGRGHRGREHHRGAQTFRRGRALEFLERLRVKHITLKQQVEAPEFQEIRPIILGELKALELVIEEYTKHFELNEAAPTTNEASQEEGEQ